MTKEWFRSKVGGGGAVEQRLFEARLSRKERR